MCSYHMGLRCHEMEGENRTHHTSECKTLCGASLSLSHDAGYSMMWSGTVNFAKPAMISFLQTRTIRIQHPV